MRGNGFGPGGSLAIVLVFDIIEISHVMESRTMKIHNKSISDHFDE